MLDERILALARKSAASEIADLDRPLQMRAAANRAQAQGNGRLYLVLMRLYVEDVGRRAQIIWRNLHRAHNSFGAERTPDLSRELLDAYRSEFDQAIAALLPQFDNDMKDAPKITKSSTWNEQLNEAAQHELLRYEAEIEHYVASLDVALTRGIKPQASYVIHGNVGALVTGAGSITNVVQNIGTEQRAALLKALDLIADCLKSAPELTERDRAELLDIAAESERELAKEQPNTRRLSFALQSLAAAVQGIASGPSAYEVLRSAAAAIGVSI